MNSTEMPNPRKPAALRTRRESVIRKATGLFWAPAPPHSSSPLLTMRLSFRLLALLGLLLVGSLQAQTYTWTGGPSGIFEDPANWTPTPSFDNFNGTYIVDGPISTHFEPLGGYTLGD